MSKRTKLLVAFTIGALAIGVGTAFAYYGGTGQSDSTQAASAGTAPRSVTVSVNGGAGDIYPGESAAFSGEISLAGSGRAHIGSLTAAIDAASLPAGCDPAWFSASASLTGGPGEASSASPLPFTGSLTFTDANELQDACSDGTLAVIVTANPTP